MVTGRFVTSAGPPIPEMARRAAEHRAQGRHIVDLTLGEPDFAPPGRLIAAAQEAVARVLGHSPANASGNPSGATYSHGELAALAEVSRRPPAVTVLSDEICAHIRYSDQEYVGPAQVAPDPWERILLVDGVSKAYTTTGRRVGAPGPLRFSFTTDIASLEEGCRAVVDVLDEAAS
jgi:aspartate/methionine/tyrosine aminotransferase